MKSFLRSFSFLPPNHSRKVVVSYKQKNVHKVLVNRLFKLAQEKSVVRRTDRPTMIIAVDLGRKATKKQLNTCTVQSLYNAIFGSIGMERVISELCYKGIILQEEL